MILKITVCLLSFLFLSGCSGVSIGSQPEEVAVISALGFDQKGNNITVTAQIVNNESSDNNLISADGETAKDAINSLNRNVSGRLYLAHCGIAVLSQKLSAEQTQSILNFLLTESEFPLAGAIAVCENAEKLLSVKSSSNLPIGYDLLNVLVIKSKNFRLYKVIETKEFPVFTVENENYRLKEDLWINQNLFPPI